MPVMPVEPHRITDITDVLGSQGALHYGYAMPVMSAGGKCITDIAEIANVEANRGIPARLISWMCPVVCPVRLDEVNGIEHVVFEVFFGGNNRMWFLTQRQRQTETDRQTDRPRQPSRSWKLVLGS